MKLRPTPRVAAAGLAYFAIVFAAGFALGTLRVLILMPRLGNPVAAILLELPIMLAISWWSSRWLIARFEVPASLGASLAMGGIAFTTLMIAELGVSVFGFGRTLAAHLEQYRQLPALLGLVGQVAFAVIPAIQIAAVIRTEAG
jgi:hypothetical protein